MADSDMDIPLIRSEKTGINRDQLKSLFPELCAEGSIDMELIERVLSEFMDTGEERYGLDWCGKRMACERAMTPCSGTLTPCPDESVAWETTRNMIIEGDNLDVLKLLQEKYSGAVSLIYIDPPYNTGKGFVYSDRFRDNIRHYLKRSGDAASIRSFASHPEIQGRFHTEWLNMICSRLCLARQFLSPDGVIAISIDDREMANLRKVCDDIFGEDRFVAQITVESDSRRRQYRAIAITHEYLLIYSKERSFAFNTLTDDRKTFRYHDEYGGFDIYELRNRNNSFNVENRPNLYYPFWVDPGEPDTHGFYRISVDAVEGWVETYPQESHGIRTVWRWSRDRAAPAVNSILVARRHPDGFYQIFKKYRGRSYVFNSVWVDNAIKTDRGTLEIKALFDNQKVFDHPKPTALIQRILDIFSPRDGIVLDFFAGSGTTGHAVMAQNAKDGGHRCYVLVQLAEPLDPGNRDQAAAVSMCDRLRKPGHIAELTKERIRRAGRMIGEMHPGLDLDLGFRVYKFDR